MDAGCLNEFALTLPAQESEQGPRDFGIGLPSPASKLKVSRDAER